MTQRAVIYARYSTDLQSAASIADQHRALRENVARFGRPKSVGDSDSSSAISGATMFYRA